jgi:hypothetical protein
MVIGEVPEDNPPAQGTTVAIPDFPDVTEADDGIPDDLKLGSGKGPRGRIRRAARKPAKRRTAGRKK